MRQPIRATAIIIKKDTVLAIHRIKNGKEYYVFPGGGVEDDETVEQALLREVQEETSLNVETVRLLYHLHLIRDVEDHDQFYYLCAYKSGEPILGIANESENMKSGNDFYEPLWIKVSELSKYLLYPLEIRDWFIEDYGKEYSNETRKLTIKVSDQRQG